LAQAPSYCFIERTNHEHQISAFAMQFVLLCLMASTAAGMVADMAAIGRAKHEYTMRVESSGDVEDVVEPFTNATENPIPPSNWTCVSCCSGELDKTRILFKAEFDTGLNSMDYTGYGAFNSERQAAFTKCGAITSQEALYTRNIQMFLAWGGVAAQVPPLAFCHKACQPAQIAHPARVVLAAFIAQVAEENSHADKKVMTDSKNVAKAMTPAARKDLFKFASEKETCRTGCFSGRKDIAAAAAKGTFCADTATASLSICKAKRFATGYGGTCSGMSVIPNATTEYAVSATIKLAGGSGSCVAKDKIHKIVCEPGNKWTAYLYAGSTVEVEIKSTCLLEEFAENLEMTIDETLDHAEHGPHAEDLLVDCYRHSLNEGISLVERSRRDASHLKHQLEDNHMQRARFLYDRLSEENQKHQTLPVGVQVVF